jgi:uncharacterized protein
VVVGQYGEYHNENSCDPRSHRTSAPSFDCNRARTTVETAICVDADLAKLDAALSVSYREAVKRSQSDKALLAALRREQSEFLLSREAALEAPGASLSRLMQAWRTWLDALGPARKGFEGAWINGAGSVAIERRPAGDYKVVAKGDDPIRVSYTCEFIGVGRLKGERLEVTWDTNEGEEDGAEGWTLSLQWRNGLVRVEQHRNKSEAATAPFCGARGSLAGGYLPARVVPEAVRAWQTVGDEKESTSRP